jgi:Ca-activated chloride channel family protein
MKRFAVVTVLLSLSLVIAATAAAQTRPRRAADGTPAPTTTTQTQTQAPDADYDPNKPEKPITAPPVLKDAGGNPVSTPPPVGGETKPADSAAPAGPEDVDENDVIKVDTALVTLPVSVTDRDGKYIGNLKQKDFKIFEDGVEQDVAYFQPTEKPFTVALLMDMSGSTKDHLREIQDAAFTFIQQLRDNDRVMIVAFDDDVHVLAEPTSDRRALRNAIQSAHPGGGTSLYEAVDFVLNQRFNHIEGRKAMVLFTDGVDTTSRHASYQSNVVDAEEDGALCYVLQYDTFGDMNGGAPRPSGGAGPPQSGKSGGAVLIDAIGSILRGDNAYGRQRRTNGGGAGTSPADYSRADSYLHTMADRTGARVERAETIGDLDKSFANIAEELRRQYSLGYYPKNQSTQGSRHAVRVRVMRSNLAVKARSSYITGEQTGPRTAPKNGPVRMTGQTLAKETN